MSIPENQEDKPSRKFIKLLMMYPMFVALLMLPSWDWLWWPGWVLSGSLVLFSISLALYLMKNDPGLFKERMKGPVQKEMKKPDKVILVISAVATLIFLFLPGLDHQFNLSKIPFFVDYSLEIFGITLMIIAEVIFFLVMKENSYAARIVKIQDERNQKVISTGPYRHVRHPMYSAVLMMAIGWPLALGSYYTFAGTLLWIVILIIRMNLEEKILETELDGYIEYREKVRYRIIPYIW
ncbi:MAG: methyltransferase family protein [Promethearchaeota archaeon]